MAYYVGYQLISFLRYCYRYGRQGAGPGSEGWLDYCETEGEDSEQKLLGVFGEDEQGEGAQAEAVADVKSSQVVRFIQYKYSQSLHCGALLPPGLSP